MAPVTALDVDMRVGLEVDIGQVEEELELPPVVQVEMEPSLGCLVQVDRTGIAARKAPPQARCDQEGRHRPQIAGGDLVQHGIASERADRLAPHDPFQIVADENGPPQPPWANIGSQRGPARVSAG